MVHKTDQRVHRSKCLMIQGPSTASEPPIASANGAAARSGSCDREELPVAVDTLEQV